MRYLFMMSFLIASSIYALQPGDRVPGIAVAATSGEDIRLSDFEGRWVVLFFYPRAFTPGCTAQSCSLRDAYAEMQERGAVVLGASLDSLERQVAFREEHDLPYHLLADTSGEVARAFDSLMPGGLAAARRSFIIAPDGTIAHRFDRARTRDHAEEVLKELDRLMAATP